MNRALSLTSGAIAILVATGLALRVFRVLGAEWVLTAGLLLLVALPVLRLLTVMGSLARAGEWRFLGAGLVTVALLAITLLWRTD